MPANRTSLYVQVYQNGALQLEKKFDRSALLTKKIFFGTGKNCDLFVPYANLAKHIPCFKITRDGFFLLLGPHSKGFLTTARQSGTFESFLAPDNALGILATHKHPLEVNLGNFAQGRLKYFEYELVFKVAAAPKASLIRPKKIPSAGLFDFPEYKTHRERSAFPISLVLALLMIGAILFFARKEHFKSQTGLAALPYDILTQIIAPETMRLLPFVFHDDFSSQNAPLLALFWVSELQHRWHEAEQGKIRPSRIDLLQRTKPDLAYFAIDPQIYHVIDENYVKYISENKGQFKNYLTTSQRFGTLVPHTRDSSNEIVIHRNLDLLKKTDVAILDYMIMEHEFIRNYYKNVYGAFKESIVSPPRTKRLVGRQPDPIFQEEYDRYLAAEKIANYAEHSYGRLELLRLIRRERRQKYFASRTLWADSLGILHPIYDPRERIDNFDLFFENSNIAAGILPTPAVPKHAATINKPFFDFVFFNKKDDIRRCEHEAGLHRNEVIVYQWYINGKGQAYRVRRKGQTRAPQKLVSCVQKKILSWRYPKPKNGPILVSRTFYFPTK